MADVAVVELGLKRDKTGSDGRVTEEPAITRCEDADWCRTRRFDGVMVCLPNRLRCSSRLPEKAWEIPERAGNGALAREVSEEAV